VSNNEVVIKEITKTLPSDTIVKNVPIEIEKWYKDQKAENKLKADIKEIYSRLLNYQEETEWMQEEFAHKDSLQKAEAYMRSIAVKSFESNFEDEYLKLKINGILAGGEVKEITPTYTLKERKANVPQTRFRLLAGVGIANTPKFDKPLFNANLGFQNAKGNILRLGYDSEQRITFGYDFSIFSIKK
jgi:CRISPR/Cas system CSM-associated protein Csm4 (group 5 of RAMP superfamily)